MQELRAEPRQPSNGTYSLAWKTRDGQARKAQVRGLDLSPSGLGIECLHEIPAGTLVQVDAFDLSARGEYVVVYCSKGGLRYRIGLEFREEAEAAPPRSTEVTDSEHDFDYYDVLQISPKAEMQTIHRVFRIMAARFHPDNPETGDVEQFLLLKRAYAVLSEPEGRAKYDAQRQSREAGTMPIFELKEFVTGVEAEANRRLGVLSLLYNQRRASPEHPAVSLLDLEERMGFPREYLSFTMWYLRAKEFIMVADNSDFTLTASGADFVEKKAARNGLISNLLKTGSPVTRYAKASRSGDNGIRRQRLLPSATVALPKQRRIPS